MASCFCLCSSRISAAVFSSTLMPTARSSSGCTSSSNQQSAHKMMINRYPFSAVANDVDSDDADLVEEVEVVDVALADDQLQEAALGVDVHRLELARLVVAALVLVQR